MSNDIAVIPVTPMDLISRAQASNASIEQMQQLFELQLRFEANEGRKAYNEAMSNFREKAPAIAKTRIGHNIKYAGLSESIEAIQPLLSQFGLSHQWKTKQDGNQISVECTVTHRMGHSESTSLSSAPDTSGGKNAIQAIGSTVSYLERYTLYAILGLSSREMDDDGKSAGKKDEDKIQHSLDQKAVPAPSTPRPAPPKPSSPAPQKQQAEDADVSGEMSISEQIDLALDHLSCGDEAAKKNLLLEASRGGKTSGAFLTYAKLHLPETSKLWLHKIMEYLQTKINEGQGEDVPPFEEG